MITLLYYSLPTVSAQSVTTTGDFIASTEYRSRWNR